MNADTSGMRILSPPIFPGGRAAWSPNSRWLVYARTQDLYLVRADGSDRHALTNGIWAATPRGGP